MRFYWILPKSTVTCDTSPMSNKALKLQGRREPVFMTLDMTGRLVANTKVVFASSGIQKEIAAATTLAQKLRKKEGSKSNPRPAA